MLGCCSPQVAAKALVFALTRLELDPAEMTLLDLGADTGIVGELLCGLGVGNVVGLDALAAARAVCLRDRPGIYRGYLVGDLANTTQQLLGQPRDHHLTGLVSAGAFG
jgi:hypothetical protein